MLADRINSYKKSQECIDKSIKHPTPAQYKAEFPFLKEVDSLSLANAQMNLKQLICFILPLVRIRVQ